MSSGLAALLLLAGHSDLRVPLKRPFTMRAKNQSTLGIAKSLLTHRVAAVRNEDSS